MKRYYHYAVSASIFFVFSLFALACKKDDGTIVNTDVNEVSLLLDYEYGYGGGIYPVYNPYILFKNGVVVKEPYIPLDEINTSSLNKNVASNWGTWKKAGKQIKIQWHNGSTSEKEWPGNPAYAAGSDEKLQGSFGSLSGSGNLEIGGSFASFSYSNLSFTSDGWFVNKRINGGGDSNNSAYAARTSAGRYRINKYKITLTFNSGDVKTAFFCFYDKNKTTFRLGGRTFQ